MHHRSYELKHLFQQLQDWSVACLAVRCTLVLLASAVASRWSRQCMKAHRLCDSSLLCCRSDLDKPDADQAEEKDDDFVKAFKVANFEITASADEGKQAPNAIH